MRLLPGHPIPTMYGEICLLLEPLDIERAAVARAVTSRGGRGASYSGVKRSI